MSTLEPGRRARGSRTGRPLTVLLDLLGRRWALRVLWELRGQVHTFRALREACGDISPTVLNQRLRELRELGLIARAGDGYRLTGEGRSLGQLLLPLDAWARQWAGRVRSASGRGAQATSTRSTPRSRSSA